MHNVIQKIICHVRSLEKSFDSKVEFEYAYGLMCLNEIWWQPPVFKFQSPKKKTKQDQSKHVLLQKNGGRIRSGSRGVRIVRSHRRVLLDNLAITLKNWLIISTRMKNIIQHSIYRKIVFVEKVGTMELTNWLLQSKLLIILFYQRIFQ